MPLTELDAVCPVCLAALPIPPLTRLLRGGRPRRYCGDRCKSRANARGRTVARLLRWAARARERAQEARALELEQRAGELRARPYGAPERPTAADYWHSQGNAAAAHAAAVAAKAALGE